MAGQKEEMKLLSAEQFNDKILTESIQEGKPMINKFDLMRGYADHWYYWTSEYAKGQAFQCECGTISKERICNECKNNNDEKNNRN